MVRTHVDLVVGSSLFLQVELEGETAQDGRPICSFFFFFFYQQRKGGKLFLALSQSYQIKIILGHTLNQHVLEHILMSFNVHFKIFSMVINLFTIFYFL